MRSWLLRLELVVLGLQLFVQIEASSPLHADDWGTWASLTRPIPFDRFNTSAAAVAALPSFESFGGRPLRGVGVSVGRRAYPDYQYQI